MKITLSEGNITDYKIIEKVEAHTVENSENAKSIPDFWTRSHNYGTVKTLLDATTDIDRILGCSLKYVDKIAILCKIIIKIISKIDKMQM